VAVGDVPGPAHTRLPTGFRIAMDRHVWTVDDGEVLFGGAPPRMLRLAPSAVRMLGADGTCTVTDETSATLARKLVDAGMAHPLAVPDAAVPFARDVTVVVPVHDRVDGLRRLLRALPDGLGGVVVVDDGSTDPAAVGAVVEDAGARLLRHPEPRGPAAARNAGLAAATTPLVAFLDSDVVPEAGWLRPLLERFADPAVGLAAPRIVALPPIEGWLGTYEAVRSSLDLGPDPAPVVPRSRVAYVPSAALLVRRDAAGGGFAEDMRVAEDVDLVLRLHGEGWRLRYEPASRVAHDHRTSPAAWWLRKAYYGTGAAPLALRHPGAAPPMVLNAWAAAVSLLLLLGRPKAVLAAAAVSAGAAVRLSRTLPVRRPLHTAARIIVMSTLGTVAQTADAVTRHYWPLALVVCVLSRRARRTVAAVAVAEGVLDWWRRRDHDPRVRAGLAGYVLARRLDDLAYGGGLWWGALRHRTWGPLRPVGTDGGRRTAVRLG
jgi:mycofactocin system glycosyltransferase